MEAERRKQCKPTCFELEQLQNEIALLNDTLKLAFPEGAASHGEYHAKLIAAAEAQKKFWDELYLDLKKRGIRAVIFIVIGLLLMKLFGPDAVKFLLKVAL